MRKEQETATKEEVAMMKVMVMTEITAVTVMMAQLPFPDFKWSRGRGWWGGDGVTV